MTPEEAEKLEEDCRRIMGFSGGIPSLDPPGHGIRNPSPPPLIVHESRRGARTPPRDPRPRTSPRDPRSRTPPRKPRPMTPPHPSRDPRRARETSNNGDFSSDLEMYRQKRRAEERMTEERKARKERHGSALKILDER